MGSLYYDLVGILRSAGCHVEVPFVCDGWERRARSSGGFSAPPLAVFWHHTASDTSPANDLSYMINGCPDAPVGNLLIDRDGICYPIAGGASNCAGKGNQMWFSRGVGAANSGNTWGFQIECANDGVGGVWQQALVDSLLRASNALNAYVGNLATDITSHALGKGNGYTDRKIDPARSTCVQGPWQPRSTNSSDTWDLDDMRSECEARAGTPRPPIPTEEDDDVFVQFARSNGEVFAVYKNGTKLWQINDGTLQRAQDLAVLNGQDATIYEYPDLTLFGALGQVIGLIPPGHDNWGNKVA